MMTYNRAILGTESLKNGVILTVILLKAPQGDDFNDTKKSNKL